MAVRIRRIRAGEGALLRQIRLAALDDAPSAFASSFEVEARRPAATWDADAAARAEGSLSVDFFAEDDNGVVGLVGGDGSEHDPGSVELVALWVAPSARRQHLGARLVAAVVDWASGSGRSRVGLWVAGGNEAAISLYRTMGFIPVGQDHAPSSPPCHDEIRMVREQTTPAG